MWPRCGSSGELGDLRARVGQIAVVVERAEIVERLERAHHRLGRRRVHEVKVHEVVDAQLLQLQHDGGEVGAQNLRVRLRDQLLLERLLGVEAKALAGPRATGATGALLRAGAADRRDEQRLDAHARIVHFGLAEARIDHIDDAVDRQRRLGDVGGDDDLARAGGRRSKDALLQVGRQRRVERVAR
jgi:hypothetical protein